MAKSLAPPKWIVAAALAAFGLIALLYGFHRTEQFLIADPRFTLAEPGGEAEGLEVTGASHISSRAVQAVFADDFGRSVYLVPLSERRASLRNVEWVKDASVARFWPNRILVGVTERKPAAFLQESGGQKRLIDSEGVILSPASDHFALPVLVGVRATDPLPQRKERVQRLQKLMKELGAAAKDISEVDVSDPDNLKVSEPFEGRSVTLLMGDRNFGLRHQNFMSYYAEIRNKVPNAAVLDLRLEDRITVVQ